MKTYDELKALITQRGVHAVFGDYGEGWGIEQSAEELAQFLVHMQALGVESVLEVGTGYKAGLARFLHDDMDWTVTSVDIHDYGHYFNGIEFVTLTEDQYDAEGQWDLVILDGDHSYNAVKFDHDYYARYAAKVIAFHDIAGLRDCEGVRGYWADIARNAHWEKMDGINTLTDPLKPGYYEIIADGDQRGGIGYIVLAEVNDAPEPEPVTEAPKPAAKKPAPRKPAAKKPTAAKKAPAKK